MEKFLRRINPDIVFYVMIFLFFVFAIFISNFRDAIKDETIYIHETYLISELFRNGMWIGDYAVGLHGFLFKIPAALIFLFTGPSVSVLTFYNILLACLACFLFYKFLKEAFGWRYNALFALGLFMANFHFLLSTPTYLREMPSLVVVMLLFFGILRNWKPWQLGLIFLLLLDVKEYLFFMFGLGYFIYICMKYFKTRDVKNLIWESIQVFGFSLIWIVLMFTTSIIPVNMFIASMFGIVDTGAKYVISSFSPDVVGKNLLKSEDVKMIFRFVISDDLPDYLQAILRFLNRVLSYVGKTLYPRTFSFLAVPKVIMLPAVYMAWKWLRQKGLGLKKVLPILLFTYLAIYLLRASHGRYLLPMVPVIAIFFINFLQHPFKEKKEVMKVLIATFIFMSLGFYFEMSYLIEKIFLEVFLLLCIFVSVFKPFKLTENFYLFFQKMTIVFCILAMLGVSLLFSFKQGQISNFLFFGENREINQIIEIIPANEKIWINNEKSYDLLVAKMEQTYSTPEWKWDLAEFLPKKNLLKAYGEQFIFNDFFADPDLLVEYFKENEIKYIVFVDSEIDEDLFDYEYLIWAQEWKLIDFFKESSVFVEEKVQQLQNKKVYLFKVEF